MEAFFPRVDESDAWAPVFVQSGLYMYILSIAANMIGDGAELLLLVPEVASLVGSIVLPILGAVPDGMMVLCSGLGDPLLAQDKVKVGVGALAGSTVMLLTLPWFLSVLAGRVSIKEDGKLNYHAPKDAGPDWDKLEPKGSMHLFKTGVAIGDTISKNAKIMLMTSSTYLVIQIPTFLAGAGTVAQDALLTDTSLSAAARGQSRRDMEGMEQPAAWTGLILSCLWFSWYLWKMYQEGKSEGALQDKIVKANVEGIRQGHMTLRGAMCEFRETTWDTLTAKGGLEQGLLKQGSAAEDEVKKICKLLVPFFRIYDTDQTNSIDKEEFRLILKDLHENVSPDMQMKIFQAADIDNNGSISFEEFIACMMAFALDPSKDFNSRTEGPRRVLTEAAYLDPSAGEEGEEEAEEEDMPPDLADLSPAEQQRRLKSRAFQSMFWGSVLVLVFSDPMCDLLDVIGKKLPGKPSFYVSFFLAPLASNASELVAAMKLAAKRTPTSMVQSLSTLEGAAIMNNTFCLAIFFLLIVWKKLLWQFSAETASILLIEVVIGAFAIMKKTHTMMDAIIILSMYPMAVMVVYALENFVGWD